MREILCICFSHSRLLHIFVRGIDNCCAMCYICFCRWTVALQEMTRGTSAGPGAAGFTQRPTRSPGTTGGPISGPRLMLCSASSPTPFPTRQGCHLPPPPWQRLPSASNPSHTPSSPRRGLNLPSTNSTHNSKTSSSNTCSSSTYCSSSTHSRCNTSSNKTCSSSTTPLVLSQPGCVSFYCSG